VKVTILSTFDTFGGASIAASRLHTALMQHGIDAKMLVQDKKGKEDNVFSIANNWFTQKWALARFAADRYQFALYEKSKAVRFVFSQAQIGTDISHEPLVYQSDILHLHWINFGFLSLLSIQQLARLNKPFVWTLHDMWAFTGGCHYSGVCHNYQQACGNCTLFLKNPADTDLSRKVWEQKAQLFPQMNLTVVTCSEWLARKARTSSLLKNVRVLSIPNPINTQLFCPIPKHEAKQRLSLLPNKQYILFAAMKISDARKGFAYFEKAIQQIIEHNPAWKNTVELLVFGQANAEDFEHLPCGVRVLGRLTSLQVIAEAYSAASVFVIPSLEENLPNTIMEAMACGTPVVGFDTGGIPEMIEHRSTGYLANYQSESDLATGIEWVLNNTQYEELCKNARKKIEQEYAQEVIAARYEALYDSLLK
jgi:glycosyltransferase involved in cell wall biosynthesis